MITEDSSARRALLGRLQAHVGEIAFAYGEPVAAGDAHCMLIMSVRKGRHGEPVYVASICSSPAPGPEAADLPWEVVDERGDTIARGYTQRHGRFRFALRKSLADERLACRLRIGPPARNPQLPLPASVWRRAARELEFHGKAAAVSTPPAENGGLKLVLNQLWLSDEAEQIPYGIACLAAVRRGQIVATRLLPMPRISGEPAWRRNWLDVRALVESESPNTFEFDAWPLTEDPRTWVQVTRADLEQLRTHPRVAHDAELRGKLEELLGRLDEGRDS